MTMTLAQKLATKQFVLTAEITPPVSFSRDELLDAAWPEVPEHLRGAAALTLAAHLEKLVEEGRMPG